MIDLLIDRLRWPGALVRERTAVQIAQLIARGRQDVSDALIAWISRQELESRAATGILPFLKAQQMTGVRPVSLHDLAAACGTKSILADLFLSHYDPSYAALMTSPRHAGPPPAGWHPPAVNRETIARGMEQSLLRVLQDLPARFRWSIARQFEFELATLRASHGDSPTQAMSLGGTRRNEFHPGWYPLTGENAASAYLRSLAWAEANCGMPRELTAHLAAFVSPVDLGLWSVEPAARPGWWPNFDTEPIPDSIEAQTAAAIQKTNEAANEWDSETNVVLAAKGCIFQSSRVQHELEIRSFFQSADGPLRPGTEAILDAIHNVRARVDQRVSPLRFEGSVSFDRELTRIRDWVILPCSGEAHPTAAMPWQAWRGMRGIQCPTDALSDQDIHAVCRPQSVDYENREGIMATWSDWSAGISATFSMGLPPATGWLLTAPRNKIERLSRDLGMRFCWAWEVTSHFRDGLHEDFKEYRSQGERGTSALAIPYKDGSS